MEGEMEGSGKMKRGGGEEGKRGNGAQFLLTINEQLSLASELFL